MSVYNYSPVDGVFLVKVEGTGKGGEPSPEGMKNEITLSFNEKKRLSDAWDPVSVNVLSYNPRGLKKKLIHADFLTSTFSSLCLTQNAYEKLKDFIEPYGELLPLKCEEENLWVLNVTNIIDAIDFERSIPYPDCETGNYDYPNFYRFAFKQDIIKNAPVFRLPQPLITRTFFTDIFLQKIRDENLTGINFRLEWDGTKETEEKFRAQLNFPKK